MEGDERLEYGLDIKSKRLQGSIIREIHDLSEDSELNGRTGEADEEEEGAVSDAIKPSELNSILERETGNKAILLLKLLTILMLGVSTLLSAMEYASLFSNKSYIAD